jgi:CelD/BcsL family acetyltransferase involved in cellulose biosynthesis
LPDTPNAPNPRDAVGLAMHALAIRRAIEHGMREYDFLQGAASYEAALCSDAHPLVELRAVAPSLRARMVETARVAAETVHARVRR